MTTGAAGGGVLVPGALIARLERLIFGHRTLILSLFALGTALFAGLCGWGLRFDCSFNKTLPVRHEYMRTYLDPKAAEFRGANRVLIALIARDGNMFTPEFFAALRKATDEVIVMDGIDRTQVQSIFTPNVRYLEVVEEGIEAGNVVPADFTPTPANMARVRDNIRKAGIIGRLVANDLSGAACTREIVFLPPDSLTPGPPRETMRRGTWTYLHAPPWPHTRSSSGAGMATARPGATWWRSTRATSTRSSCAATACRRATRRTSSRTCSRACSSGWRPCVTTTRCAAGSPR